MVAQFTAIKNFAFLKAFLAVASCLAVPAASTGFGQKLGAR
jgi:hypothetical protein